HAVLGSDPALPGTPQEARHAAFHTGGTDHLGIAELDQYRALRMPGVVTGQGYLTKLIGGAATGSCHFQILVLRVCAAIIRGRVGGTRRCTVTATGGVQCRSPTEEPTIRSAPHGLQH